MGDFPCNGRSRGFTFVEIMCVICLGVIGFLAAYGYMEVVREKAVWVICNDTANSAVVENINEAIAGGLANVQGSSNSVTLFWPVDALQPDGLQAQLYRYVDYPEGTNTYAVVRTEACWYFYAYHSHYTNWMVTYVFQ